MKNFAKTGKKNAGSVFSRCNGYDGLGVCCARKG